MKNIAQQIYNAKENIILIYAFNSTGKTRLSVEYKNYTKNKNGNNAVGVYYNAYSEDLFQWNNDEDNDNADIKAFVAIWEFDEIIFIEHLAVNPEFRNEGLGSLILISIMQI